MVVNWMTQRNEAGQAQLDPRSFSYEKPFTARFLEERTGANFVPQYARPSGPKPYSTLSDARERHGPYRLEMIWSDRDAYSRCSTPGSKAICVSSADCSIK